MTSEVKRFIERHIGLINSEAFVSLFNVAISVMTSGNVSILSDVLSDIGIDTTSAREEVLRYQILEYVRTQLASNDDSANSWSRFDCMIMAISTVGFSYDYVREYVINNADELHLNLRELEPQYGWEGAGDLDLGWFNEQEYAKEYFV